MKIGMVTQWYEPETGSAAHPTAIARALAARGHEVKVLTGFPSYPEGAVHSGYAMSWRHDEVRDGIRVRRVPDVPSHDQSAARRAASLVSFAGSATTRARWLRDCDVVLTYLTPATVGLASWTLKRLSGVPYVLYVQDLWPETVTASGFIKNERMGAKVETVLHRLLRVLYRDAGGVAGISPSMAETLTGRMRHGTAISIPNWVDEDVFREAVASGEPQLPSERRWLMYAGGIGEVQALDHSVHAMALLERDSDLGLAFVGDGVARPRLEMLAKELGVEDRVLFLGRRPIEDMPSLLAESMAQLVSLQDLPLFEGTIPSKLQASMASGVPVVCAVRGEAAAVVRSAGAGLVVPPENPTEMASAFATLAGLATADLQQMGAAGRSYYETNLSADVGVRRLENLLEEAVRTRS